MLSYFFIGGDLRMLEVYRIIKNEGFSAKIAGMESVEYCDDISADAALAYVSESKNIILPIPYTRDGKKIFAPNSKYDYTIKDILSTAKGRVFYGASTAADTIDGINILDDTTYAENNARLTAECTVELISEKYGKNIANSRVLICGYGKVGRNTANLLSLSAVSVSVCVRNINIFDNIIKAGFIPLDISYLSDRIGDFDIIINTVPARIFDAVAVECMKKNSICLDLASYPHGIDHSRIDAGNIFLELGLPGKMHPQKEALAIHKVISGMREEMELGT